MKTDKLGTAYTAASTLIIISAILYSLSVIGERIGSLAVFANYLSLFIFLPILSIFCTSLLLPFLIIGIITGLGGTDPNFLKTILTGCFITFLYCYGLGTGLKKHNRWARNFGLLFGIISVIGGILISILSIFALNPVLLGALGGLAFNTFLVHTLIKEKPLFFREGGNESTT